MLDRPALDDLLEVVARFLRERAVPALPKREAFEARIAANALELARREARLGDQVRRDELARLIAILGHDGDLSELNRELASRLRDGRLDPCSPQIASHLWLTTVDKLRIDQPDYSGFLRATATRDHDGENNGL